MFSRITNSVSEEIGSSLIHSVDVIEAWCDLATRYSVTNDPKLFSFHEEIYGLKQGDLTVAKYHGKLTQEESLNPPDVCSLGSQCRSTRFIINKRVLDKTLKFLMGLTEVHMPIKSQILAMKPISSLNEVYAMIVSRCKSKGIEQDYLP